MANTKNRTKRYHRGKRNKKQYLPILILVLVVLAIIGISAMLFKTSKDDNEKTEIEKAKDVTIEYAEKVVAQPVDDTILEDLITNAETIETKGYTKESAEVFNTALKEAKAILKKEYDQTQVNTACKKLLDAIQQLQKK